MGEFKFISKIIAIFALVKLYVSFEVNINCPSNKFYDTTLLDCNNCPDNMIPSLNGKNFSIISGLSCECSISAIINKSSLANDIKPTIGCVLCPSVIFFYPIIRELLQV